MLGVSSLTSFLLPAEHSPASAELRKVIHLPGRRINWRELLVLVSGRHAMRTYFGPGTTSTLGLEREKTTT